MSESGCQARNNLGYFCELMLGHVGHHETPKSKVCGHWGDDECLRLVPARPPKGPGDAVNHPPHYIGHPSGIECIEISEWLGFNLGNAFKYLFRRNSKGDLRENLEKAVWYLEREAKREGVWFDEVPVGTLDALRVKVETVAGYEPYHVGAAMTFILQAAIVGEATDKAIQCVQNEIKRVCE